MLYQEVIIKRLVILLAFFLLSHEKILSHHFLIVRQPLALLPQGVRELEVILSHHLSHHFENGETALSPTPTRFLAVCLICLIIFLKKRGYGYI